MINIETNSKLQQPSHLFLLLINLNIIYYALFSLLIRISNTFIFYFNIKELINIK